MMKIWLATQTVCHNIVQDLLIVDSESAEPAADTNQNVYDDVCHDDSIILSSNEGEYSVRFHA